MDIDIQSFQKEIRQALQTNIHRKLELALCLMGSQIAAVTSGLSNKKRARDITNLHCELIIISDLEKTNVEDTQSERNFESDRSTQRGCGSVVCKIERRDAWTLCDIR
jgi:hypothetical protein